MPPDPRHIPYCSDIIAALQCKSNVDVAEIKIPKKLSFQRKLFNYAEF